MSHEISNNKTSIEFQDIVLYALLRDEYLLAKISPIISEEFFHSTANKIIYKNLVYYTEKYNRLPTKSELMVCIRDLSGIDLSGIDIVSALENLYQPREYSENFIYDSVTKFIQRTATEKALSDLLPRLANEDSSVSIEDVGQELINSFEFDLYKSTSFNLSEIDKLSDVRLDAVGSIENPSIIKSCIPEINSSLQFNGYKSGDLAMICLLGSTKIKLAGQDSQSIEDLYLEQNVSIDSRRSRRVYSIDPVLQNKVNISNFLEIRMTGLVRDYYRIYIGDNKFIEATGDHEFLLARSTYKSAKELQIGDILCGGTWEEVYDQYDSKLRQNCLVSGKVITDIKYITVEYPIPVYDIIDVEYHNNFFIDLEGGESVVVHNCAPPGCFIGSTKILNPDGTSFTLQDYFDLSKTNFEVNNYDIDLEEISTDLADSIYLSRYENVLMRLVVNGKEVICTLDHPFLLEDGTYTDAQFLDKSDRLLGIDKDKDIMYYSVDIAEEIVLDKAVPVYGIVDAGKCHNYTLDIGNGGGIFVSNTGKTMFMVNEGSFAASQGFKVLHLFLGDMKEYDGFIRYASRYLSVDQNSIANMTLSDQMELIKRNNFQKYFSNITVSSYAAGELTIDQMVQEVYRLQEMYDVHYDLILVDYADNLQPAADMMYESGGTIYNKLSNLGFTNRSVVIVGSQPKPAYWDSEIIPKAGAAESSKKQHVIDVMITIGCPSIAKDGSDAKVATMFLAKVRRGVESIIRLKLDYKYASINSISDAEYIALKG